MSWSPIQRIQSSFARKPAQRQAGLALALEAGTAYVRSTAPVLIGRIRLLSIRGGVVHAQATSAPAAHELSAMREGLFLAMQQAAHLALSDLRVEIRGRIDSDDLF